MALKIADLKQVRATSMTEQEKMKKIENYSMFQKSKVMNLDFSKSQENKHIRKFEKALLKKQSNSKTNVFLSK